MTGQQERREGRGGAAGQKGGNRPAGPEAEKGGRVRKNSFLFFLKHIFKSKFKSHSNSFSNFNQTKASQNKYASA